MAELNTNFDTHRLTRKEKEANDFQWYKEKIDSYDKEANNTASIYGGISEYKRMKVNCDLYNNIIDLADFAYVCTPFGAKVGELPANMVNRDISSYRIKTLLGMEMKRPFGYKVLATNVEATTRREEEQSKRIRDYVIEQIMLPIKQQVELQYQEQTKGRELTPQEKKDIQDQIAQAIQAQTPPEVKRYMERDHQDPSEVQGHQIMEYLMKEQDIKRKFNNGWKYGLLTAYEVYWVGIVNNKPVLKVVNPIRFNCDKSPDLDYIENGEWAVAEWRMSPSDVVKTFKLTDKEIDDVYKNHHNYNETYLRENLHDFSNSHVDINHHTVKVIHVQFKGLRKVGWLDYIDKDGNLQTRFLVDEQYKLNRENGDVKIEWEWIPETYEGYKIGADIYKNMQPVPGQTKDVDTIYECKLSYHGVIYDNTNSQPTCPMDRMRVDQYYYDIIWYRIELLMASDKGKKVLMNINAIPESAGIDVEKWQYFFESTPFMWYNPDEEGMTQQDVNTIAKTIDLSLASDINNYINLAMAIDNRCGKSVGVTDPVLGQTSASQSVGNNQQNLIQTSHILEPYFDLHASVKKNVLNSLLTVAKIAYTNSKLEVLNYVLDDMSRRILDIDVNLLDNSTLGLFIEDSGEAQESQELVRNLAHAAMQNQTIELSDVLAVVKQKGTQEAEEALKAAEKARHEREDTNAQKQREFDSEQADKAREHEKEVWANEKDNIILKEEERRKTVVQAQAMMSMGFNENKDVDNDGQLDIIEVMKNANAVQIQMEKTQLENRKLDHTIENDKEKNSIERSKINMNNNLPKKTSPKK
jgi:hypothetical protein